MNPDTLKRLWDEVREDIAPDAGALAVARLLRARGSARLPELRFTLAREGVPGAEQMPLLAHLVTTGAIREGEGDTYLAAGDGPAIHYHADGKGAEPGADDDPADKAALIADILGGLLGGKALLAFRPRPKQFAAGKSRWDTIHHPRDPKTGRFIKKGSAEAVAAAHKELAGLRKAPATRQNTRKALEHLSILTVKQLRDLQKAHGLKAPARLRDELVKQISERLPGSHKADQSPQPNEGHGDGPERHAGGRADAQPDEVAGEPVAEAPGRAGDEGGARGGPDRGQPPGERAARAVPAHVETVNRRLDRYEKLFRSHGNHRAADWMGKLRDHVNRVGAQAALDSLGEAAGKGGSDGVQYRGAWEEDNGDFAVEDWVEPYLNRAGISLVHHADAPSPDVPVVSPRSQDRPSAAGGHAPVNQTLRDKLAEAQHLPGLEKSEDLGKLLGGEFGGHVAGFTPDVLAKLDATYGKGGWIVKSYDDDAYAGFGVFFPQRVAQIQKDAQNTIWSAGEQLARYGFKIGRDPDTGKVIGLVHDTGDTYPFGTPEYEQTIQGDARHWADRAALAGASEHGTALPRGREGNPVRFMAQPAFPVVGVSDADRAAGKTHEGTGEGRVHVVTRGGKVEVIPHSTWIKGEQLPVVFESDDTRAMAEAARKAIEALPESERGGQLYAPDVVRTADGFRVVEANPANEAGGSGWLGDNPFMMDAYASHITGREPAHVQFIRRLLSQRARAGKGAQ